LGLFPKGITNFPFYFFGRNYYWPWLFPLRGSFPSALPKLGFPGIKPLLGLRNPKGIGYYFQLKGIFPWVAKAFPGKFLA